MVLGYFITIISTLTYQHLELKSTSVCIKNYNLLKTQIFRMEEYAIGLLLICYYLSVGKERKKKTFNILSF